MRPGAVSAISLAVFLSIAASSSAQVLRTHYQESAPKYYRDGDRVVGLCVDIIDSLNRVLETDGVSLRPANERDPFVPFRRLQADLEAGRIDVFVGFALSPEREQAYVFLDEPAYMVRSTFAVRRDEAAGFPGPRALEGLRVGIVAGSKTGGQMAELGTADLIEVGTISQAIQVLAAGRVDAVFYHSLGMGHAILELGLRDQIILVEEPFEEYGHYVAFHSDVPNALRATVAAALEKLREEGEINRILERYGQR